MWFKNGEQIGTCCELFWSWVRKGIHMKAMASHLQEWCENPTIFLHSTEETFSSKKKLTYLLTLLFI